MTIAYFLAPNRSKSYPHIQITETVHISPPHYQINIIIVSRERFALVSNFGIIFCHPARQFSRKGDRRGVPRPIIRKLHPCRLVPKTLAAHYDNIYLVVRRRNMNRFCDFYVRIAFRFMTM